MPNMPEPDRDDGLMASPGQDDGDPNTSASQSRIVDSFT